MSSSASHPIRQPSSEYRAASSSGATTTTATASSVRPMLDWELNGVGGTPSCACMLARLTTHSASVVALSAMYARRRHGGCHHAGAASGPASTWISPRHARRATLGALLAAGAVPGIRFTISG